MTTGKPNLREIKQTYLVAESSFCLMGPLLFCSDQYLTCESLLFVLRTIADYTLTCTKASKIMRISKNKIQCATRNDVNTIMLIKNVFLNLA